MILRATRQLATSAAECLRNREAIVAVGLSRRCSTTSTRTFFPPGPSASPDKPIKFEKMVCNELDTVGSVIIELSGATAAWNSLRALAVGNRAAEFTVVWVDVINQSTNQTSQKLRLSVRPGIEWDRFNKNLSEGHFVSNLTDPSKLAQALEFGLRKKETVTLHAFADAQLAVEVMLKALASVPGIAEYRKPLTCTVGSVKKEDDGVSRVIIHATSPNSATDVSDFVAYPPGPKGTEEAVNKFRNTVREVHGRGGSIVMECRGKDANWNALFALASVRGKTADVRVHWVDSTKGDEKARVLRLRAVPGESWEDFNARDFTQVQLLKATEKSDQKMLVQALGNELRRNGQLALHAWTESKDAVTNALSALARLPAEFNGMRLSFIPSLGKSKEMRSLRLFVLRKNSMGGKAQSRREPSDSGMISEKKEPSS